MISPKVSTADLCWSYQRKDYLAHMSLFFAGTSYPPTSPSWNSTSRSMLDHKSPHPAVCLFCVWINSFSHHTTYCAHLQTLAMYMQCNLIQEPYCGCVQYFREHFSIKRSEFLQRSGEGEKKQRWLSWPEDGRWLLTRNVKGIKVCDCDGLANF